MVVDELIVRKGTTNLPIDSYADQVIDEIVYEGNTYHFAKQKDVTGTNEVVADNSVQEPLISIKVSGNTVQDGTPTPTTPQPIYNAGDNGMSLELSVNGNITTIAIPTSITVGSSTIPLRFARVDDKADYIEVNRLDGTVKYIRNIAYTKLPYAQTVYTYIGMNGVRTSINGGAIEETMTRATGYCTHTDKVGKYMDSVAVAKNAMWLGVNNTIIYWVGILDTLGFTTVEEFNTWLDEQEANGTPVELIYQLKTPVTTNITNTDLGQSLLALATEKGTNILTISSEIPVSQTDLSYWRQIIPNE